MEVASPVRRAGRRNPPGESPAGRSGPTPTRDDRGIVRRFPEDRARCSPRVLLRVVGLSESWFYKWRDRPPTPRQERRAALDAAVKASFEDSGGNPGTYGSPRVFEDLIEVGWKVSINTVAASMARQGLRAEARSGSGGA